MKSIKVHNWSRYPAIKANIHSFRTIDELKSLIRTIPKLIARGSGLSYGDASLSENILSTKHFNKILSFDTEKGTVTCESGMTLDELLKIIVPKGWFLPVTPGTKFITVGGAVGSDVHGKNHHKEGSFCHYVEKMKLMDASGKVTTCGPNKETDTFHRTCGGMGLTGVVLEVTLRLKRIESAFIYQENMIANNLSELVGLLKKYNDATYSVAWIDCLTSGDHMGRGVLMLGEHALKDNLSHSSQKDSLKVHNAPKLTVPIVLPSFLLNSFTIGVFNLLYFYKHKLGGKRFLAHYESFFYPLDFIKGWNKLYGKRGFLQYQFVIPFDRGEETLREILTRISESKQASFLSVLKLLGGSEHSMDFPMDGFTLALDLPISDSLFPLLDELDEIVVSRGGRIYLAKDARMNRDTFNKGYPQRKNFQDNLSKSGASEKFESLLSRRLLKSEGLL